MAPNRHLEKAVSRNGREGRETVCRAEDRTGSGARRSTGRSERPIEDAPLRLCDDE